MGRLRSWLDGVITSLRDTCACTFWNHSPVLVWVLTTYILKITKIKDFVKGD